MSPPTALRVLRVYHSGVVRNWRQRDRELRRLDSCVTLLAAARWNEGGRDVTLVAEEDEAGAVVGLRTWGRHPYRFVYDPIGLWHRLRISPVDVIDIHEEPASLAAFEVWLIARLAGRRAPFCLYSAQNIEKRYPVPFRWIERFLLRRAAAVHTCNDAAGAILRRKGFAGIVVNLGLGVDIDRFTPAEGALGDLRRVGYVGRLERHKGVHVLVDAMAELPGTTLEIVGDGPEREALTEQIRARGLDDRVTITGFVPNDELPAYFRTIGALAVPSIDTPTWIEQFGRVAVEAMASGVPVVASASGSLVEVVGDAGRLVPPEDPTALAAALRSLEGTARADLGERARARAERWSWPQIAARQHRLYLAMLDRGLPDPASDGPPSHALPLAPELPEVEHTDG